MSRRFGECPTFSTLDGDGCVGRFVRSLFGVAVTGAVTSALSGARPQAGERARRAVSCSAHAFKRRRGAMRACTPRLRGSARPPWCAAARGAIVPHGSGSQSGVSSAPDSVSRRGRAARIVWTTLSRSAASAAATGIALGTADHIFSMISPVLQDRPSRSGKEA